MASLKQTQIYGALRIYNAIDENTTFENTISIDPEENNGKLTFSDGIVLPELSFTGSTSYNNSITNVHSIEFDSIQGNSIEHLYELILNDYGFMSFGNNITLSHREIDDQQYLVIDSANNSNNLYITRSAGNNDGVKLKWNGTTLDINQPLTTKNITIQSGIGYSTTLSPNNEDNTLHLNGGITINPSVAGSSTKVIIKNNKLTFMTDSEESNIEFDGSSLNFDNLINNTSIETKFDDNIQNSLRIFSELYDNETDYVTSKNSIMIGSGRMYADFNSIALGLNASAGAHGIDGSTIRENNKNIGNEYRGRSIAIGTNSLVSDINTDGQNSKTDPYSCIAIGANANASSNIKPDDNIINTFMTELYKRIGAIAIGVDTDSYGSGIAIGSGATTGQSTLSAIAIGSAASVNADGGVAIGPGVSCAIAGDVCFKDTANVHANSFQITSDRMEKTDIRDFRDSSYLKLIMDLKPVSYRFNYRNDYAIENGDNKYLSKYGIKEYDKIAHSKGEKAHKRMHLGFIAQDVKAAIDKHFPNDDHLDIVSIHGMDTGIYQNGEIEEGYEKYTMNYSGLIPVLVKAIQEQQEEIEYLKTEIERLKK